MFRLSQVGAVLTAVLTVIAAASRSNAQMVTLGVGSYTQLAVRGTDNVVDFEIVGINALPASGTLAPTALNATATATYAYANTGFVLSDVAYGLGAAGEVSSSAELYGQIFFTPTTSLTWDLSGSMTWEGDWMNGMSLFLRITDTVTNQDVTLHNYGSNGVLSSETLTVGVGGGNFINVIGPVTGTLMANRQYRFEFDLAADCNPFSPEVGHATGGVALALSGGVAAVTIISANPPLDNPYIVGSQSFRDVLQTGNATALTQGIGAAGTPAEGSVTYAPISVTFSSVPSPAPAVGNVSISCTGGPCPAVTGVTGANPYLVSLSGSIPPGHCTTLTFQGTAPAQKVQYQYLPMDVNMNNAASAADVQALILAADSGQASLPPNLPRYDINRNRGPISATDILRAVGLLNGVSTTQVWAGVTVATCP